MNHDSELARALRELPDVAPGKDLWPQIAGRIAPGRPRKNLWTLAAAVSGLALVLALWTLEAPPPSSSAQVESEPKSLLALRSTSAELEALLNVQRVTSGRYSGRMAELERTLAQALELTDIQISLADNQEREIELWQRRIALLSTWHDLGAFGADATAHTDLRSGSDLPQGDSVPLINHQEDVL